VKQRPEIDREERIRIDREAALLIAARLGPLIDAKGHGAISAFSRATGRPVASVFNSLKAGSLPRITSLLQLAVFVRCDLNWLVQFVNKDYDNMINKSDGLSSPVTTADIDSASNSQQEARRDAEPPSESSLSVQQGTFDPTAGQETTAGVERTLESSHALLDKRRAAAKPGKSKVHKS
jgi:hypothetical protein